MKKIHALRNFLLEEQFKIQVYPDKIDVQNYTMIGHFDSHKVTIQHTNGEITIQGENLVVSKLMNDEVLIIGKIQNIELR